MREHWARWLGWNADGVWGGAESRRLRQSADPARLRKCLYFLFYNVKNKVSDFPSLFPARESLVGDIPAGDGKIANLFFSVQEPQAKATLLKKVEIK